MAALLDPAPPLQAPELVDLRSLSSSDLEPLLSEEIDAWSKTLDWDFEKSADLVRKFVDLRAINGAALVVSSAIAGYCYYVFEEHKGLVGDLYIRKPFQNSANEQALLASVLRDMIPFSQVRRIEAQLMMLTAPFEKPVESARYFHLYPRDFLVMLLPAAQPLERRRLPAGVSIEPWSAPHQEAVAQLIAATYSGHVDSKINDQYRSVPGARRFLTNIVQYPGCGSFFQPASFSAFHRGNGSMAGICLASIVGPAAGHITQLCISPDYQGVGLGYEMLRRSIEMLHDSGCRKVSLTVTSANTKAQALYASFGFHAARKFAAYVWEGW